MNTSNAAGSWPDRFLQAAPHVPHHASARPDRAVFLWARGGPVQVYASDWGGRDRRVTDSPDGVAEAVLDPTGEWIWWRAAGDGPDSGWYQQGWTSPVARRAAGDLGADALVLPLPGSAAVTVDVTPTASRLLQVSPEPPALLRQDPHVLIPVTLLSDDPLLTAAVETGDQRNAVHVLDQFWQETATHLLPQDLDATALAPSCSVTGRVVLLLQWRTGTCLRLWDYLTGTTQDFAIDLPGELDFRWDVVGDRVVAVHRHHARSELIQLVLRSGRWQSLLAPEGWIADFSVRPDGTVDYRWSTAAVPPVIQTLPPGRGSISPRPRTRGSVHAELKWVPGPAGPIHVLTSRPPKQDVGTVCLLHGGPAGQDSDAFSPEVAAWIDSGFTVIQANYRGSVGYGLEWASANMQQPGLTELEDMLAVRQWAQRSHLAREGGLVLAGTSWGGYLALLAAGLQPLSWDCFIAARPIADYVRAFADEPAWLQEIDIGLFGGTPDELPVKYARSSPVTYVRGIVRPTLIQAGDRDDRCPLSQVEAFLSIASANDVAIHVDIVSGGHSSSRPVDQVAEIAAQIEFALHAVRAHQGRDASVVRTSGFRAQPRDVESGSFSRPV